jgi:glycosyltransferase involved in cell wall biosynthesis
LSSRDSERDCLRFLPFSKGKTVAVPFSVKIPEICDRYALKNLRARYKLPSRFVYLPNQLWQHKNHITVLRALLLLRQRGVEAHVVATGSPSDYRNPEFPRSIFSFVEENKLDANFLFLGLIPYADIDPLMRASCCVINPSLFEGWSTTVEEAKALGVPLLLSNIAVHVEQAPSNAVFFSPLDPEEIANSIEEALSLEPDSDSRIDREISAINRYRSQRINFGRNFLELCNTVRGR